MMFAFAVLGLIGPQLAVVVIVVAGLQAWPPGCSVENSRFFVVFDSHHPLHLHFHFHFPWDFRFARLTISKL
jgi:hypothetical protein